MKFLFNALLSTMAFGMFVPSLMAACWYKNGNPNDIIAEQNGRLYAQVNNNDGEYTTYVCDFGMSQDSTLTINMMGDDVVSLGLYLIIDDQNVHSISQMHYDLNHRPNMTEAPQYLRQDFRLSRGSYRIIARLQNHPGTPGYIDLKKEIQPNYIGLPVFNSVVYETGDLHITNVNSRSLPQSYGSLILGEAKNCYGTKQIREEQTIQICYPGGDASVYSGFYRIESHGALTFYQNISQMIWQNVDDELTIEFRTSDGRSFMQQPINISGSGRSGFYLVPGTYQVVVHLRNYGGDATANIRFQ